MPEIEWNRASRSLRRPGRGLRRRRAMPRIDRLRISSSPFFFFSSRRRHTRYWRDWSSDVCSSDLWWRAAQIFIRWARAGVWERLLSLVQEHGVQLGMVFLDGTSVRAHQKAAGARPKGDLKLSEMIVRHLAGLVAAMGPKLACSPRSEEHTSE